jgi:FkbM family methyltransferase
MIKSILNQSARLLKRSTHPLPTMRDVEKAEQIFYIRYLEPGMRVFDVGANIGELTLLFSRFVGPEGQVHTFEAASETFRRLHDVIQAAGRPNVTLSHKAVSDHCGTARFHVYPSEYSGWNTLADRPLQDYGIDVRPALIEEVPTITIDDYCQEHRIDRIDLLKIDVEGAEYQVLCGARRMLAERRIACCLFEFGQTTFDMGNSPSQLQGIASEYGYAIRNLNHGAPVFPGGRSAATALFSIHVMTPSA